jgi:hypothetical protein
MLFYIQQFLYTEDELENVRAGKDLRNGLPPNPSISG